MAKRNLPSGESVPMEPGERKWQVSVQQLTDTIGETRFPVETWTALTTLWMRKMDLRQDERFVAGQEAAAFDTQWESPYVTSLDPETVDVPKTRRLVYKGRVYDIVSASMIGRREGIEFLTIAAGKV